MKVIATAPQPVIHTDDVESVIVHNGNVISTADDGKVKVWDLELQQLLFDFKGHDWPIYHLAATGDLLYTAGSDSIIKEWKQCKGNNWEYSRTLEGHGDAVHRISISNGVLYSGDETGEVRMWEGGITKYMYALMEEIWDLIVKDNCFYTARDKDIVVTEFSPSGDSLRFAIKGTFEGRAPLCLVDNKIICTSRCGKAIHIHEVSTGYPCIKKFQAHDMIINAMCCNSTHLFSGGWDKGVKQWNLNTMTEDGTSVDVGFCIKAMCCTDTRLYVGGADGLLAVVELP